MSARYQKLAPNDQDSSHDRNQHYEGSSTTTQQHNDLQDSFGEAFDDDDDERNINATDRLLPHHTSSHGDHDSDDDDNDNDDSNISLVDYSQSQQQSSTQTHRGAPAVLPVSNDGVFANMSAKPESQDNKLEETPPTYEEAAADATPPYWQTTIIAPAGMGDLVLVEGMPVGSIFAFFWNVLISASFQFVGFMLTYLLHTSHASKQGSRAGLGISLVQTGFYIRSRGTLEDDDYLYGDEDSSRSSSSSSSSKDSSTDADIISYFLMIIGWFIIIRSLADYFRAKQMEKIICSEPNAAEAMV